MTGLATGLNQLARWAQDQGDVDGAVGLLEESIGILSKLADQAPDDPALQADLAEALQVLGITLFMHERHEAAVAPLRRANSTYRDLVARLSPEDPETRKEFANSHLALWIALNRAGRPEEALAHLNEGVDALRTLAERAPDDRATQNSLAQALGALGGVQAEDGRLEEAADSLSRSANISQLLADLDPDERPDYLISVLHLLAEALRDLGRTDEADEADARAGALEAAFPEEDDEDEDNDDL